MSHKYSHSDKTDENGLPNDKKDFPIKDNKYLAIYWFRGALSGFCSGLSLLWEYCMQNEKGDDDIDWFNDCYFKLATWDGKRDLPQEVEYQINRFLSMIIHFQIENKIALQDDSLEDIRKVDRKTVVKRIKNQNETIIKENKTIQNVAQKLSQNISEGKGAFVNFYFSPHGAHATAVLQKHGKIIFFDPNAEYDGTGRIFDNAEDVAQAILDTRLNSPHSSIKVSIDEIVIKPLDYEEYHSEYQ